MNEIKSEKAKEYLSNQNIPHYEIYSMGSSNLMGIDIIDAKESIIIAEAEAQNRAVESFCHSMNTGFNCKKSCIKEKCKGFQNFITELNK